MKGLKMGTKGIRKIYRWAGLSAGGIVVLLLLAVGLVYFRSGQIISKAYAVPAARSLYVPSDSATKAWGQHLATTIVGCADCHGAHFEGMKIFDDPAFGKLYAPNLTSGQGGFGVGTKLDITAFERALRLGVRHTDGSSLWVMPSFHYDYLSDEDVAALYTYVKNLPPINQTHPERALGPVGRTLLSLNRLPLQVAVIINPDGTRPPKPKAGPTAEYGEYLARISCIGCHGPNLSGGPIIGGDPAWPPAANLTKGGIGATYTEQDFFTALREGKRPAGGAPLSEVMPWKSLRGMNDEEIQALWAYLQSIPAAPYSSGNWLAVRTP
jgi:mono/diheme cytochrome c family protein